VTQKLPRARESGLARSARSFLNFVHAYSICADVAKVNLFHMLGLFPCSFFPLGSSALQPIPPLSPSTLTILCILLVSLFLLLIRAGISFYSLSVGVSHVGEARATNISGWVSV